MEKSRTEIEWFFKRETEDCFCATHDAPAGRQVITADSLQGLVSKIKTKENEIYGNIPNKFTKLIQMV